MKIGATLRQSLRSIFSNPVRSALTVLGVVIGIAAVIAVVGLGKGLEQAVSGSLSALDATRLTVSSQDPTRPVAQRGLGGDGPGSRGGSSGGGFRFSDTEPTLTRADVAAISGIPGVRAVSPEASRRMDVTTTAGAAQAAGYSVVGVSAQYPDIRHLVVAQGSWLTSAEVTSAAPVVVLGARAATELFPSQAAVGSVIFVSGSPMRVIGVLAGSAPDSPDPRSNPDDRIFTGYLRWAKLTNETAYPSVLVTAVAEDQVPAVAVAVTDLLRTNHRIAPGATADTAVSTAADLLKARSQITGAFTTTLTAIAAVSLLVGGIGIMNIMLVTVTERTREIGLRRAVGAKGRHILGQFLAEAVMLTLIGGVLGLGLGYLLGSTVGTLLPQIPGARGRAVEAVMDPSIALLAVVIAVLVGVLFGLFPAIRAARLDPATALRHD